MPISASMTPYFKILQDMKHGIGCGSSRDYFSVATELLCILPFARAVLKGEVAEAPIKCEGRRGSLRSFSAHVVGAVCRIMQQLFRRFPRRGGLGRLLCLGRRRG